MDNIERIRNIIENLTMAEARQALLAILNGVPLEEAIDERYWDD